MDSPESGGHPFRRALLGGGEDDAPEAAPVVEQRKADSPKPSANPDMTPEAKPDVASDPAAPGTNPPVPVSAAPAQPALPTTPTQTAPIDLPNPAAGQAEPTPNAQAPATQSNAPVSDGAPSAPAPAEQPENTTAQILMPTAGAAAPARPTPASHPPPKDAATPLPDGSHTPSAQPTPPVQDASAVERGHEQAGADPVRPQQQPPGPTPPTPQPTGQDAGAAPQSQAHPRPQPAQATNPLPAPAKPEPQPERNTVSPKPPPSPEADAAKPKTAKEPGDAETGRQQSESGAGAMTTLSNLMANAVAVRSKATVLAPATSSDRRNLADPQTRFLALALVLEEAGIPSYVRTIILTLIALVMAGLVWAAITSVDEVAVGSGHVTPAGSVQVVQHLEGGIVSKILVGDGDLVKSGDVLIRLDPAQTIAELSQVRAREAGLILQARRLQAFVTGKEQRPLKPSELAKYRSLAADQLAILRLQEDSRLKQRNLLKRREASIRRQLRLVSETYRMRRRLMKRGAVSRRDFIETSREREKLRGDLSEIQARQTELDARLRSDALTERGKVTAELAQVRERIVKLSDRVRRLDIRAPARGYVKGITVTTEGGVIRPGQNLMEVVPIDRELLVEVRISTRDIGHIKVGQGAKVKIDTYDFSRYGAITGKLVKVSATTFRDEKERPYYKGTIKLAKAYLGRTRRENPIQPGMTVQAEIITGSKTVLQYLLKPVQVAIETGFRER